MAATGASVEEVEAWLRTGEFVMLQRALERTRHARQRQGEEGSAVDASTVWTDPQRFQLWLRGVSQLCEAVAARRYGACGALAALMHGGRRFLAPMFYGPHRAVACERARPPSRIKSARSFVSLSEYCRVLLDGAYVSVMRALSGTTDAQTSQEMSVADGRSDPVWLTQALRCASVLVRHSPRGYLQGATAPRHLFRIICDQYALRPDASNRTVQAAALASLGDMLPYVPEPVDLLPLLQCHTHWKQPEVLSLVCKVLAERARAGENRPSGVGVPLSLCAGMVDTLMTCADAPELRLHAARILAELVRSADAAHVVPPRLWHAALSDPYHAVQAAALDCVGQPGCPTLEVVNGETLDALLLRATTHAAAQVRAAACHALARYANEPTHQALECLTRAMQADGNSRVRLAATESLAQLLSRRNGHSEAFLGQHETLEYALRALRRTPAAPASAPLCTLLCACFDSHHEQEIVDALLQRLGALRSPRWRTATLRTLYACRPQLSTDIWEQRVAPILIRTEGTPGAACKNPIANCHPQF
ncbi:hypothetical protein CDCA_CDCA02G0594 [Cyanidium caldarium]|uniref:Uncharacterized protein n=1 Tax=Cyanidium caldarium TaxID=2771 RepID=A0AAV9IQH0_CYACA|nr:hypothetical protein CDCA_CDCA02G0594 [Cyanidium caldarium]|eukprot:ctg_2380.g512